MMLVDAGRGQEALDLDDELLGYLRDGDTKRLDVLEGDRAETIVSATKCVDSHEMCFQWISPAYMEGLIFTAFSLHRPSRS